MKRSAPAPECPSADELEARRKLLTQLARSLRDEESKTEEDDAARTLQDSRGGPTSPDVASDSDYEDEEDEVDDEAAALYIAGQERDAEPGVPADVRGSVFFYRASCLLRSYS